jgi:hydrogenase expression/formation protein HypC
MCLAVPAKLLSVDGVTGIAELGGVKREVGLQFVPEAEPGEYVLLHAGFAIQVVDEEEAKKTMAVLDELFSQDEVVGE